LCQAMIRKITYPLGPSGTKAPFQDVSGCGKLWKEAIDPPARMPIYSVHFDVPGSPGTVEGTETRMIRKDCLGFLFVLRFVHHRDIEAQRFQKAISVPLCLCGENGENSMGNDNHIRRVAVLSLD